MASIPLALHYLDKDLFGLWALAAQINGYLILIDVGMNGSVSRFIADHKDEVNDAVAQHRWAGIRLACLHSVAGSA